MFKKYAIAAAITFGSILSAQASTVVTNLGLVQTTTTKGTDTTSGSFSDFFNFTVGPNAGSILVSTASTFANYGVSLSSLALYEGTFSSTSALSGMTAIASSSTPISANLGGGIVIDTVGSNSSSLNPLSTYTLEVNGTSVGDSRYTTIVQLAPVPEPETYAMLLAGLGMVGFIVRRRSKNRA